MDECSPQLEKGHTRIANELFDAIIRYPFNATEQSIILFIIRRTYGWSKKADLISYGQIEKATAKDPRNIKKYIKKLIEDKVISKTKVGGRNMLSLNKCYVAWRLWIS